MNSPLPGRSAINYLDIKHTFVLQDEYYRIPLVINISPTEI